MKKTFNIIALSLSFFLFACEEVIEIDLNQSSPQWVIEAHIDDEDKKAQVRLSKTGSYFDPGSYPVGTGASISIKSSNGQSYELAEETPGNYIAENVDLQLLDQYNLKVELAGKTYEAFSVLQPAVSIDSLSSEFRSGVLGLGEGYYLRLEFQDPPGVRNYLRFEITVNGFPRSEIALYDDNLTDGNKVSFPLFVSPFQLGDKVVVKAYSLDYNLYKYWTSLSEILGATGGGESAAPANPPSNLTNDALGYFEVSSVSEVFKEIN